MARLGARFCCKSTMSTSVCHLDGVRVLSCSPATGMLFFPAFDSDRRGMRIPGACLGNAIPLARSASFAATAGALSSIWSRVFRGGGLPRPEWLAGLLFSSGELP